MIWLALTVRFLLELALLTAYGFWAALTVEGTWRWPATIAVPLAVAVLWGLFLSPKAPRRLPTRGQWTLEAVLFAGAGLALWSIGAGLLGASMVALWFADRLAIAVLGGLPKK